MNKIKGYRNGIGLSQKALADILKISELTYRNKEKGKNEFTKSEIECLFKLFNEYDKSITLESLFF